jgi:hypothetical protein
VPFFVLVRQQLAVFLLLFVWISAGARPGIRLLAAYVLTSLAAGFLSVYVSIIGEESLEGGFSQYLISFNERFMVGYLLFNPVRVMQYFYDVYASFQPFNEFGGIDTAKLLRWPQLILLGYSMPWVLRAFMDFKRTVAGPARPMVIAIAAFFVVWLMNPTINARYMMLVTPIMILLGFYMRRLSAPRRARA